MGSRAEVGWSGKFFVVGVENVLKPTLESGVDHLLSRTPSESNTFLSWSKSRETELIGSGSRSRSRQLVQ